MIATTTPSVDGYRVSQYLGIVAGEVARYRFCETLWLD